MVLVIRIQFFLYFLVNYTVQDLKTNDFTFQVKSAMARNPLDTRISGHLMFSVNYSGKILFPLVQRKARAALAVRALCMNGLIVWIASDQLY